MEKNVTSNHIKSNRNICIYRNNLLYFKINLLKEKKKGRERITSTREETVLLKYLKI